jgi:hypothetical protein
LSISFLEQKTTKRVQTVEELHTYLKGLLHSESSLTKTTLSEKDMENFEKNQYV